MPIFGQVWLWSLLAFLLGALLCWVLVVLPVRRRIAALESRLASLRADAKVGAAAERSRTADRLEPISRPGERPAEEIRADTLTRAYALPGVPSSPPLAYRDNTADARAERGAPHLSAPVEQQVPADSDWFDEQAPGAPAQPGFEGYAQEPQHEYAQEHEYAHGEEDDEEHGTIFTQRTGPILREEIRRLDDGPSLPEPEPEPEPESRPSRAAHRLGEARVDDAAVAEPDAAPTTFLPTVLDAEPEPEPEPAPRHALTGYDMFTPRAEQVQTEPEVPPAAASAPALPPVRPAAALATERTTFQPRISPEITVQEPERSPAGLPKRIPAKPQHRVPFGVAVSSPAQPVVTDAAAGDRPRSLFEPVIAPEDGNESMPPPPNRLSMAAKAAGGPGAFGTVAAGGTGNSGSGGGAAGPFGPGSAMPLPGGGSPSPEFTVKASVTALRYCTPDSTQFGRTTAEVWFRSAADAERVGFRPVG